MDGYKTFSGRRSTLCNECAAKQKVWGADDHAEEARRLVDAAHAPMTTDYQRSDRLAEAGVHASLAVYAALRAGTRKAK